MAITAKTARKRLDTINLNTRQKEEIADLVAELSTSIENLNTWATALATKLNTDFTAQNGVVAGSQLDVDYDTDPQA